MNEDLLERLVVSFESIAKSLGEIGVIGQRIYDHKYPERTAPREAVTTRVKTEEDLVKERQGDTDEPVGEWLSGYEDKEFLGARERAFLEEEAKKRDAGPETGGGAGQDGSSTQAPRGKTRATRKHPAAESND
jgi:hypothetical protein